MLLARLVYFLLQLCNQPFFSKEPWFLLLELLLETKIWALAVLLASGRSQLTGQGNKCMHTTLVCTRIREYFSVQPFVSVVD